MEFYKELNLLTETFKKCRIEVNLTDPKDTVAVIREKNYNYLFLGSIERIDRLVRNQLKSNTVYRVCGELGANYMFMPLNTQNRNRVLSVGPFLSAKPTAEQLLLISEKYGIPPKGQKLLELFYESLTVLPENSPLFCMLDAFAECVFGNKNTKIVDITKTPQPENFSFPGTSQPNDTLINMRLMEERYAAENLMMQSVAQGQAHKGTQLMAQIGALPFEKRLDDPLRNLKNYSIIMNTLLRKSAELGGVHPLYIDGLSSSFALKIEQMSSVKAIQSLMQNMYNSYCRLVQEHNTKNYSAPVKKAILVIDRDLSSELTLSTIAESISINPSYLSSLFKQQTGKSITEYIKEKRMQLAAKLIKNTSLQIQTVAQHCGIMDVQYFSKLFKKHFGKTPKEYGSGE